jgi:16S rRNA C967 or C1407 C5-methylase (RsmB/RsmF family)
VLLDAPCSGLGVIAKDPSAKVKKVKRGPPCHALRLRSPLSNAPSVRSLARSLGPSMVLDCCGQGIEDILLCSKLQKELILAAIDCVDAGPR